jgi:hypothetical protein
MKPITASLVVMVFALATGVRANQHSDDCKRVRTAGDKLLFVVENSWGPGRGNFKILDGVVVQGKIDIETGQRWAEKIKTINVDPLTGDPLDCSAVAAKHQAYLAAYETVLPRFQAAAQDCVGEGDAPNGKCGASTKGAFAARDAFIKTQVAAFAQAEKSAPPYCQASYNGFFSGLSLRSNGKVAEPCARATYSGGRAICANIPLKSMRDGARDACAKNLDKIKDPVLATAKNFCGAIKSSIEDKLAGLSADFNSSNKAFFEASITAVVTRNGLLSMKKEFCDAPAPVYQTSGSSGGGGDGGGDDTTQTRNAQ